MSQQKKQPSKAKLIEGPVAPLLVQLTIPMIWGLLAISTFNLVDTIFLGKLGTVPLAAISFTFPVVMVITNLAIGLGVGASSVVARAIGEHNHEKIQILATSSVLLALILVVIFVCLGLITIEPLFLMLGATDDTLPLIKEYMTIWYLGVVFLMFTIVGNFIIRATGDSFWPGILMVISSGLNLILDPILIFGLFGCPRLEVKGAAIATVISGVFTFLTAVSILYFREKLIVFRGLSFLKIWRAWGSIVHVGLPAAGTNMIIPIATAVIMSMVSVYGKEAVAAFGAASRVEMFAILIFLAMSSIIGPFVGQNMGGKRSDRIQEALRICYRFCLYFGLFMAIILAYFSEVLMRLFDKNELVIQHGTIYLLVVPFAYVGQGIVYIASGVFNGSGHPVPAILISLSRMFLLYIPLAYIFKYFLGLYGIFCGYALANAIAGVCAVYWSFKYVKSFKLT